MSSNRGRSAMALIAGCFLCSALMRAADPSSAFAVEVNNLAKTSLTGTEDAPTGEPVRISEEKFADLLTALQEREAQLVVQESKLAEKQRVIQASEARLREQMKELEETERRLAETLRIADRAADEDVERLVIAFEAMDSKRAAPIFENMDIAFASGLISRMKGKTAADILGGLSSDKAYAISVHMVGQNARAPTK